jgi:hypothetical protein
MLPLILAQIPYWKLRTEVAKVFGLGSSSSLITGFQTRNGARASWIGGVELFSDDFAKKRTLE